MNLFTGIQVTRQGVTIFIPLPVSQWTEGTRCDCDHCKGRMGYRDTINLWADAPARTTDDMTGTVHHPTLHRPGVYAAKWEAERMRAAANTLTETVQANVNPLADVTDAERAVTAIMKKGKKPGV